MTSFSKLVNGQKLLTIFIKRFILTDRVRNMHLIWFAKSIQESTLPLAATFKPHTLKSVQFRVRKRRDTYTSKTH